MEPPTRTNAGLLSPPPPPLHHPSSLKPNRWGPYSSAKDFDANMATVVIVLIIAAVLAFCLLAAIRLLLRLHRRRRRPPPSPSKQTPQKAPSLADSLPSLVFSAGTQLAGAGAECAICLTEFADGDGVKVLPACNHGFHVKCVEAWLSSRSSCPTCRRCCRPVADPPERPPEEP